MACLVRLVATGIGAGWQAQHFGPVDGISLLVISSHVMPYPVVSRRVIISSHLISSHLISSHLISSQLISPYGVFCLVLPCPVWSCHVMPRYLTSLLLSYRCLFFVPGVGSRSPGGIFQQQEATNDLCLHGRLPRLSFGSALRSTCRCRRVSYSACPISRRGPL